MLGIKLRENLFLTFFLILVFLITFNQIDNLITKKNLKLVEKYDPKPYIFGSNFIHCTDVSLIENCIEGIEKRKNSKKIVIIGNSQLHHINRIKENDILISEILFKNFIKKDVDIVTLSLPNINLQEVNFIFQKFIKKIELDYLVISLVFDDLRETSVRNELIDFESVDESVDESVEEYFDAPYKNLLIEKIKDKISTKKK